MNNANVDISQPHSDWQSLKRLWHLAGPFKHQIVRGIVFRFLQSFCLGLGYGVAIIVVTSLMTSGQNLTMGWFYQMAALACVSLVGQLIFSFLSSRNTWMASFEVASELRICLLRKMSRLPLGFHLSRHRGDAVTTLTTDMQTVETFLSDGLPRIAEAFGLPIAVLIYVASQNMLVFAAAIIPILVSIPIYIIASKKLAVLGLKRQDTQASASARMIEYIQGLIVIKSFNRLAKGQADFEQALDEFRTLSNQMTKLLVIPFTIFGMVTLLGVPVLFYTSSVLWSNQQITLVLFVTVLMLIYALYTPLLGLIAVLEQTRMADASLTRINRLVEAQPLPEPQTSHQPLSHDICFDHVSFAYSDDKQVIHHVNFQVPSNTVTAIVGPSGAGKSTLLNLMARFWDVGHGQIKIGGVDIRDISTPALSQLVTFVFQDVYLFSGSIKENILMGRPDASEDELVRAVKQAQAYDFIMALPNGFDTQLGEGGSTLSGGERQRLSIARAILKDAPIILMDEATAAIDPCNERAFYQAFRALCEQKTVLIVAHKLSTIRYANQIIVMQDGYVVEQGDHAQLVLHDGLYHSLWHQWSNAAQWKLTASRAKCLLE